MALGFGTPKPPAPPPEPAPAPPQMPGVMGNQKPMPKPQASPYPGQHAQSVNYGNQQPGGYLYDVWSTLNKLGKGGLPSTYKAFVAQHQANPGLYNNTWFQAYENLGNPQAGPMSQPPAAPTDPFQALLQSVQMPQPQPVNNLLAQLLGSLSQNNLLGQLLGGMIPQPQPPPQVPNQRMRNF